MRVTGTKAISGKVSSIRGSGIKQQANLYLMAFPAVAVMLLFSYMPMVGLLIAFKNYDITKGYLGGSWAGLKYFIEFFKDPYCWRIIRNTFLLNFYGLLFGFPAPIILALLLNEVRKQSVKRIFQSISYLPYFISTIIIVGIMMRLFATDGVVNQFLNLLGIKSQMWFNDPKWFRTLYVASGIWQSSGYSAIIYLAAITGINTELYEAAVIDGAGRWKQMLHVTVPGIGPTIRILLILQMGHIMTIGFDKVFLMYNPGIYETADVIATYIYRRGIVDADYSFSTAASLFNAVIAFVFIFSANFISKKTSEDSLW